MRFFMLIFCFIFLCRIATFFYQEDISVPAAAAKLLQDLNDMFMRMLTVKNKKLWDFLYRKIGLIFLDFSLFFIIFFFQERRWENGDKKEISPLIKKCF